MVTYKNKIIPVLCAILLMLLVLSECRRRNENQTARKNLDAATSSLTYYKNKLGTQTASVKTLQLDNRLFQNLILKKDAELRELSKEFATIKSVVKFKTVTRFDTLYVPFKETIGCAFKVGDTVSSKYYSFDYEVDSTGLSLTRFEIPNQATIITGYKRKWLLGKQILTTDITNSNPYIKTENIMSAEVVIPEPWYKKWYVWLAAGIVTGAMIK